MSSNKLVKFKVLKFKKSDFAFIEEENVGLPGDLSQGELRQHVVETSEVLNSYYAVYMPMERHSEFQPFMVI